MQVLSLFLVLALVACTNKNAEVTGGNPESLAAPSQETKSVDSKEVAEMRAAILNSLTKQRDLLAIQAAKSGKKEDGEFVAREYNQAIQKIANLRAESAESLEKDALKEYRFARANIFNANRAKVAAAIPTRINPEPLTGEKRDAADAEGKCTIDIQVDLGNYSLKAMDTVNSINNTMQRKGPLASVHVKLAASSLVDKCDEIVDRYGDKAVCKLEEAGSEPEEFKMSEFKQQCESTRQQFSKLM
jgi:hypothetical protein